MYICKCTYEYADICMHFNIRVVLYMNYMTRKLCGGPSAIDLWSCVENIYI